MDSLTKKVIKEDTSLWRSSSSLWGLQRSKPEIRQIYGHFLPPFHMKLVKGLVAKDFNFPSTYHAPVSLFHLNELYEIRLTPESVISINHSIKIRTEREGVIVYTPYFNGFYMNKSAYEILRCCDGKMSIYDIVLELGCDSESVIDFIARTLTLGLANVCLKKSRKTLYCKL